LPNRIAKSWNADTALHSDKIRVINRNACAAHPTQSCLPLPMDVLALTILISSCLAGIFVVCFAIESRRSRRSSIERDSLLPLDDAPSKLKNRP